MAVRTGRKGEGGVGSHPSGTWTKALVIMCLLLPLLGAACSPTPLAMAFGGAAEGGYFGRPVLAMANPTISLPLAAVDMELPLPTATAVPPTVAPTEPPLPTATAVPPTVAPTELPLPTATAVPPTAAPTEPPLPTATAVPPADTAAPIEPPPPADSPPDRIAAPAIGLDVPVVEMGYQVVYIDGVAVTGWQVPRDEAAFHQGSAYPGRVGNTVVSGHNNVGRQVFRALGDLGVGDEVILYVGQAAYRYAVSERVIVREAGASYEERVENGHWILPTGDERLTLVTCYPYPASTHRLIIVALPLR